MKPIFATSGCSTRRVPTIDPLPTTTLITPSGIPASSASSASRSAESGVSSAGFSTTVFPVASAGPSFQEAMLTREVPGHDQADDAERLPERERLAAGDRDRLAVVLVDGAGVEVEDLRDHAHLAARARDRLADVARLDPRQLLRVLLDQRRQPPQQPGAIGGRHGAPGRERRLRPRDGRIGLLDPRLLELGERLLGRGIENGQHRRYSTIFVSSVVLRPPMKEAWHP